MSTDPATTDDEELRRYFAACHARVAPFVDAHFAYPGAWHTNRRALGADLLRAPLNLAWAPVYVLCQLGAALCRSTAPRAAAVFGTAPAGLRTSVQRYVEERIETELLGLTEVPRGGGDPAQALPERGGTGEAPVPPEMAREALGHYGSTRTAAADIGNSVAATLVGAFALKKFTPGGIAIGLLAAAYLARARASRDFWLGDALGSIWYDLFPPQPTLAEAGIAIGATLAVLATLASLSGLVLDPLQRRLGLHQRRLHAMLEALERDVTERVASRYRPRDPLLARILEAVDAARGTLPFG